MEISGNFNFTQAKAEDSFAPVVETKASFEGTCELENPYQPSTNVTTVSSSALQAGEYIPKMAVRPKYPLAAKTEGIEGEVFLDFTVSSTGNVSDIKVIKAEPKGVFEDAAIRAVRQYIYEPQYFNGQKVNVTNVRTKVAFKLSDDR
jgi:protein TonB